LSYSNIELKTLSRLFLVTFIVFILLILDQIFIDFDITGDKAKQRLNMLIMMTPYLIFDAAFWWGVAKVTKEKRGALIAFCINLASMIFFLSGGMEFLDIGRDSRFLISLLVSLASFLTFGWLRFKNTRGLLIVLVVIAYSGLTQLTNYTTFYETVGQMGGLNDFDDYLKLSIPTSETSWRMVDVFHLLYKALQLPLQFLLFLFIYDRILREGKVDWSLKTAVIPENLTRKSYSMIYWSLRFPLFVITFGGLSYLTRHSNPIGDWQQMWGFLSFVLGVFVLASFYRNFVTGYLLSKGKKPSWQYLILHLPVIHIFGWIHTLLLKSPQPKALKSDEDEKETSLSGVEKIQKDFGYTDKSPLIKGLLVIFMILNMLNRFGKAGITFENMTGSIPLILYSVITIGLALWYMNDHRAIFVLFIAQIVLALIILIAIPDLFWSPIFVAGLVNVLVYFGLFHFDKIKFATYSDLITTEELSAEQAE
jgi:hypothetical protein